MRESKSKRKKKIKEKMSKVRNENKKGLPSNILT